MEEIVFALNAPARLQCSSMSRREELPRIKTGFAIPNIL
jgi:hypothetical protein